VSGRQRVIAAVALVLAIAAIAARLAGVEGQLTFVLAAVALIGLAWLLGEATEQAGGTVGPRASALLNASFGNLPEIVIVVLAINAGLNDIARASIIGSVTGNILLILGIALFMGGLKNGIQKFNARLAATNSSMLVLAVIGMGVPTLFQRVDPAAHDAEVLSVWTALILTGIYLAYVYFSFATPGLRYIQPAHASTWSRREAVVMLALAAVATGVVSEVLVKSIEPVVHEWGLPRAFIGFVLVPFVGNVPEHFSAVRLSYRNSVDFAMGISFGSAIQVALFASAIAVFASLFVGHTLTLVFPPLELGALGAAAVVATLVARGGETNWLEGLQLMGIYVLVAASFWLYG
jgi:Ca2+:H+ antiporter